MSGGVSPRSVGGYTHCHDHMVASEEQRWADELSRLRDSLRRLASIIEDLTDAEERVAAVSSTLDAIHNETVVLQRSRLTAIASLRRAGFSYGRIAALTGLSKARVAQLSRISAQD